MDSETPVYSTKPVIKRTLCAVSIKLFLLGLVFYVGIIFNVYLLDFEFPIALNLLIISFLILLIVIQLLFHYKNNIHVQYVFYQSYIEIIGANNLRGNSKIFFYSIENVAVKRNLFDKLFGTVTLSLSKEFNLLALKEGKKMYDYIIRMVQYNKQNYQSAN